MSQPGNPEVIDAMLRNLLMDWNGNTHRAELSVDKFHNYNAPNGQNGLIEFRAFEMVPDPGMLLAANVLLRALTACFAENAFHPALGGLERSACTTDSPCRASCGEDLGT